MQGFGSEQEHSLDSPAQGASPELGLEVRTPHAPVLPSSPGLSYWLSPLCVPLQRALQEGQPDPVGRRVAVGKHPRSCGHHCAPRGHGVDQAGQRE